MISNGHNGSNGSTGDNEESRWMDLFVSGLRARFETVAPGAPGAATDGSPDVH